MTATALPTPADPSRLPPCDLVMKGGITSGVVYPQLIQRLSDHYRFRSVGGTSAGAIAAAGCVAAEFGRQSGSHPQAFERLAELPQELGKDLPDGSGTKLLSLFQASDATRDHFAVLLGSLNAKSAFGAVAGALRALLAKFWPLTLLAVAAALLLIVPAVIAATALALGPASGLGVLLLGLWLACTSAVTRTISRRAARHADGPGPVGMLLAGGFGLAALVTLIALHAAGAPWPAAAVATLGCAVAVALCIALALALACGRFTITLLAGLCDNFWGLCSGRSQASGRGHAGLTDWLTGYFDQLAGVTAQPRPLTFGDLWLGRFDDAPPVQDAPDTPPRERELDFQVMTTAVSQQMSYSLPLRDDAGAFYYDPAEWARLFPERVMHWLAQASAAEAAGRPAMRNQAGAVLARLPANRYLPVVVAVRMSLSFPVLLAAVPLYARDMSLADQVVDGQPVPPDLAKKVWFSDGGISSNMPLHMFDAPLPGRPTFAVNLKGEHPADAYRIDPDLPAAAQKGRVYLPQRNASGRARFWREPDDSKPAGLFGFLMSIVDTMQNWRDEIQFPYPGFRDRIVQVSQRPDEGGLNLNMPPDNIRRLAAAGAFAGEELVARFHPEGRDKGEGWQNHQRLRLRTFLGLMEALARHPRIASTHWDEVADELAAYKYNAAEIALAKDMLRGLRGLGEHIAASGHSLEDEMPKPRPEMRISPRL